MNTFHTLVLNHYLDVNLSKAFFLLNIVCTKGMLQSMIDQVMGPIVVKEGREVVTDMRWYPAVTPDVVCFL